MLLRNQYWIQVLFAQSFVLSLLDPINCGWFAVSLTIIENTCREILKKCIKSIGDIWNLRCSYRFWNDHPAAFLLFVRWGSFELFVSALAPYCETALMFGAFLEDPISNQPIIFNRLLSARLICVRQSSLSPPQSNNKIDCVRTHPFSLHSKCSFMMAMGWHNRMVWLRIVLMGAQFY